jgi:hypothetical protein
MPHDEQKWDALATNGDVARVAVTARRCSFHLFRAVQAQSIGDDAKYQEAIAEFKKADDDLRELVNEVGGLDPNDRTG